MPALHSDSSRRRETRPACRWAHPPGSPRLRSADAGCPWNAAGYVARRNRRALRVTCRTQGVVDRVRAAFPKASLGERPIFQGCLLDILLLFLPLTCPDDKRSRRPSPAAMGRGWKTFQSTEICFSLYRLHSSLVSFHAISTNYAIPMAMQALSLGMGVEQRHTRYRRA